MADEEERRENRGRRDASPELALLIDTFRQQLLLTQQEQAALRGSVPAQLEANRQACEALCDRLRKETEERLHVMNGDMEKLREEVRKLREEDLQDLRKAIIGNQSENYKRIIGAQAAVLLLVLSAVVGLLIQQLHH